MQLFLIGVPRKGDSQLLIEIKNVSIFGVSRHLSQDTDDFSIRRDFIFFAIIFYTISRIIDRAVFQRKKFIKIKKKTIFIIICCGIKRTKCRFKLTKKNTKFQIIDAFLHDIIYGLRICDGIFENQLVAEERKEIRFSRVPETQNMRERN